MYVITQLADGRYAVSLNSDLAQGPKGDKGDEGEQGIQGIDGPQGVQGIQGVQGVQGLRGQKGDRGNDGPAGNTGPAGGNGGDIFTVDAKIGPYTVVAIDKGRGLCFDSDDSTSFILPNNLPKDFHTWVIQAGEGEIGFVLANGATLVNKDGYARTDGKGSVVRLIVSRNDGGNSAVWNISGDLDLNGSFRMELNYSGFEGGSVFPGTPGFDYPEASLEHFKYYKSKGLNHVRLPIKWERAQPVLNGALDNTYMTVVDQAIAYAATAGITITLDVHNYGGRQVAGIDRKLGTAELPIAAFADLWSKLATRYVANNTVTILDLMNEPESISAATWKLSAQAAINAIRQVEVNKTIMVEGVGYSSAYQWVTNGNDTLKDLDDPEDNLMFSAHCYLDRNNSGTHFVWTEEVAAGDELDGGATLDTNIGVKRISVFIDWLKRNNLRGNIGEIGVAQENPNWLLALDKAIAYAQANRVSFTYWCSGPFFDNYPYSIGLGNEVADRVQMAVLTKYSNPPKQELTYFITGPKYGTADVDSADFTLNVRGNVPERIIFTPTDGGQGGLFTPSSIEIPAGFNGKATFKYKADYAKVFKINVENDYGLVKPKDMGYSATTDMFMVTVPQNIQHFYKIKADYLGPCIRLRRAVDNDIQDFDFVGFQMYARLDTAAIKTWAKGGLIYIVKYYDQSGNGYDWVPVKSIDGGEVATPDYTDADQARLIFDEVTDEPVVYWNNSRYDVISPMDGKTGFTVMMAMKAKTTNPSRVADWELVDANNFMSAGGAKIEGETILNSYNVVVDQLNVYTMRYRANTVNGLQLYKNGTLTAQQNTVTTDLSFQHRQVANLGYFKFDDAYKLDVGTETKGWIVWGDDITNDEIAAFQARFVTEFAGLGEEVEDVGNEVLNSISISKVYEDRQNFIKQTAWEGHLVGVNLAAGEFGSSDGVLYTDYTYPTNDELDYYHSKGIQIIRLPFKWERLQRDLYAPLWEQDLNLIKGLVTHATGLGMRIILDPHNYSDRDGEEIGTITAPWAAWEDFFTKLATEFKSNPLVVFLTCNEPTKTAAHTFLLNQHAINGIRAAGAANLIQCAGNGFASASNFLAYGNEVLADLYDPFDNFHFEVHQYLNPSGDGESDTIDRYSVGPERLQILVDWMRARGFKFHLGEYNAGTQNSIEGSTELLGLRELQAYIEENHDVCVSSTIWAGGPWWGEYRNTVEPTGGVGTYVDSTRLLAILSIKDEPYPDRNAIIDVDFTRNRIAGIRSLSEFLDFSCASSRYMLEMDGSYKLVEPELARINERGLMLEEERINYLKSVPRASDGNFSLTNSSVEYHYPALDNTDNAFRILADTANGRHGFYLNNANWVTGVANTDNIVLSLFQQFDTITQYSYFNIGKPDSRVVTNVLDYDTKFPLFKNKWVRNWYNVTLENPTYGLGLYLQPDSVPNQGHESDGFLGTGVEAMKFWMPQVEKALYPSSPIYVPTKGTAVTREADEAELIGKIVAMLAGDCTIVVETEWLPQAAVNVPILTFDSTVVLRSSDDYKAEGDMGGSLATAAMPGGVGSRRIPTKYGYSQRVTGTDRVTVGAEFASSVAADQTITPPTNVYLGPVNGYVRRIRVYEGYIDAAAMDTLLRGQ